MNSAREISVITGVNIRTVAQPEYHRGILIDKIPVRGFPGLLFGLASMIIFLGGIPAAREFLLITGSAGMLGSGLLYWWHNQTTW